MWPASVEASDMAFIQYTSGSQAIRKAWCSRQSNVLANMRGIGWAVNFRPDRHRW